MKVTVWSDYVCPYCYIAERRLKRVLSGILTFEPLVLEKKAYRLNPKAPLQAQGNIISLLAQEKNMGDKEIEEYLKELEEIGKSEGIDMDYAKARMTSTLDAHRLTKYAQIHEKNKVEELSEALFHAYFSEGKELANHDVLREIAKKVGLEGDKVKQVLQSDLYETLVTTEEDEAVATGVEGVPFLLFGNLVMKGLQPSLILKDTLERALMKMEIDVYDEEGNIKK